MLQNILVKAVEELQSAKAQDLLVDFAIIGGFAVSAWGYARATEDIDFAVKVTQENFEKLATHLNGQLKVGDAKDNLKATINLEIESQLVQLIVFPKSWEEVAFSNVQTITLHDHPLPFVGWKQIVLLKLYAGSIRDLDDVKKIIDVQDPGQRSLDALKEESTRLRVSKKLNSALGLK